MLGLSVALTVLAVAAWRLLPGAWIGWALLGAVLAAEVAGARRR